MKKHTLPLIPLLVFLFSTYSYAWNQEPDYHLVAIPVMPKASYCDNKVEPHIQECCTHMVWYKEPLLIW